MANTKNEENGVPGAAIAAGVLAAGAAAAAGYYFYGAKNATKHRKAAVKWAHDMKRDVMREAKRVKGLGEDVMNATIDRVASSYTDRVNSPELTAVVDEMKKNWRKLRDETTGGAPSAKKVAKRAPAKKKMTKKRSA